MQTKDETNRFPNSILLILLRRLLWEIEKAKSAFSGASSYSITFETPEPIINIKKVNDRKYAVTTTGDLGNLNDVFLEIDYVGDRGMAFIDSLLVTDHFYHEKTWDMGMKSYLKDLEGKEMVLIFHPLFDNQECLIDFSNLPEFEKGRYLEIKSIKTCNAYKTVIGF